MLVKKSLRTDEIFSRDYVSRQQIRDDLFSVQGARSARLHECFFQKIGNAFSLPSAIVPFENDAETLYADVATYHREWSPISAHINIYDEKIHDFRPNLTSKKAPQNNQNEFRQRIWVALILGESAATFLQSDNERVWQPSYESCRRSLAFCLARADTLYHNISYPKVAHRWSSLRFLSKMDFPNSVFESVLDVSGYMNEAELSSTSEFFAEGLARPLFDLARNRLTVADVIDVFENLYGPEIRTHVLELRGRFDGRMKAFLSIAELIKKKPTKEGKSLDSIALAFFANLILPGSMEHFRPLRRLANEYPSILVWYSFFAGVSSEADECNFAPSICKKIIRDLNTPFSPSSVPLCDISFDELSVLSRVGLSNDLIKPVQPRVVMVSLLPGVDLLTRFSSADSVDNSERKGGASEKNTEDFDKKRMLSLLAEMQTLLEGAPREENRGDYSDPTTKKVAPKTKSIYRRNN